MPDKPLNPLYGFLEEQIPSQHQPWVTFLQQCPHCSDPHPYKSGRVIGFDRAGSYVIRQWPKGTIPQTESRSLPHTITPPSHLGEVITGISQDDWDNMLDQWSATNECAPGTQADPDDNSLGYLFA